MATIAPRRPGGSPPATFAGNARLLAPLAIGGWVLISSVLRPRDFGVGFWIDEGLSVGIAAPPLSETPAALRLDGSPPLYYALLHVWMAVFGSSEEATHALSLLFAVLAVPAAWWAARGLFGDTAGLAAALLAATNPFLTHYAQETRMYALVALLGLLACGTFGRAFVLTGTAAALPLAARGEGRKELFQDGLLGFGGALLLFAPWLPALAFQVQHTGAPWSNSPDLGNLAQVPGLLLGTVAQLGLLLAAGAGAVALLDRRSGGFSPRGRALLVMAGLWAATVLVAFAVSQVSPAWATRYLAVALPPLLLAVAGGPPHG